MPSVIQSKNAKVKEGASLPSMRSGSNTKACVKGGLGWRHKNDKVTLPKIGGRKDG